MPESTAQGRLGAVTKELCLADKEACRKVGADPAPQGAKGRQV